MIMTDTRGEKWRVSAPDELMPELLEIVVFWRGGIDWSRYARGKSYIAGDNRRYTVAIEGHNVALTAA